MMARWAVAVFAGWLAAAGAAAAEAPLAVDLELVLAVDVSGSIDGHEARIQREGYVAAFRDADVLAAIRAGYHGRIAVAYLEWSGADAQRLLLDWRLVANAADAHDVADRLAAAPVEIGRYTSISRAIVAAAGLFAANAFAGERRVIDISGDGPNNHGPLAPLARDAALEAGITINGLPILNERVNRLNYPRLKELAAYYRDCVIGGPGAFIVIAQGFDAFAAAIKRKLILEVAGAARPPSTRARPRHATHRDGRVHCDIGERQLQDFLSRLEGSF